MIKLLECLIAWFILSLPVAYFWGRFIDTEATPIPPELASKETHTPTRPSGIS